MARDLELMRHLLLAIEEAPTAELLRPPPIIGFPQVMVDHHGRLLIEAGLAVAAAETRNPRGWLALRFSWIGHEYLDTIRDPLIRRYTRRAARRVGSWSLDTIGSIAKASASSCPSCRPFPLLLLAAFLFARSHPEWERKIVEHPRFGPPIQAWRERGAIGVTGKTAAILALATSGIAGLLLLD